MQKQEYQKKRNYVLCGIMTTIVNMGSFSVLVHGFSVGAAWANILAWALSVSFAYMANKIIVYRDFGWERRLVLREMLRFFFCRAASGALETMGIFLFCDLLQFPALLIKAVLSLAVLCINFISSEKWVFHGK